MSLLSDGRLGWRSPEACAQSRRSSRSSTDLELSRLYHELEVQHHVSGEGRGTLISAVQRSMNERDAACRARRGATQTGVPAQRLAPPRIGDCASQEDEDEDIDDEHGVAAVADRDRGRMHKRAVHASAVFLTYYKTGRAHGAKVFPLPQESIYSAALAIPQIARSSGWCLAFSAAGATVSTLSVMTLVLQIFFSIALHRESSAVAHANGKPNLCTYGTEYNAPGGPKGPFGVTYDPQGSNLETSAEVAYRTNILWTALKQLGQDDLAGLLGPVDIGIQSPSCRLVCMGIFCVAVVSEMRHCWDSALFLRHVPTTRGRRNGKTSIDDAWIQLADDQTSSGIADADQILDDLIIFKMNGIPRHWKWFWCIPVVVLQSLVVLWVGYLGSRLLLATGAIIDLILNSTALVFVLEMDRLAYKAFVRHMTHDIMQRLQPFRRSPDSILPQFEGFCKEQRSYNVFQFFLHYFSGCQHMFAVALLVVVYYATYLVFNCEMVNPPFTTVPILPWTHGYYDESHSRFGGFDFWMGRWVSKDVTAKNGEVTCAPFRPNRPTVQGCGLPHDWNPQ